MSPYVDKLPLKGRLLIDIRAISCSCKGINGEERKPMKVVCLVCINKLFGTL